MNKNKKAAFLANNKHFVEFEGYDQSKCWKHPEAKILKCCICKESIVGFGQYQESVIVDSIIKSATMNIGSVFQSEIKDSTIVNATVVNCKLHATNINGASLRNGFFDDVNLYSRASFAGKHKDYHPIILEVQGYYITVGDNVMTFRGKTQSIRRWKEDIKNCKIETNDPVILSAIKFIVTQAQ